MDIAPPFGYQDIVALQRTAKVRLPQAGEVPAFARTLNAIPLSLAEFAPAMREYPIVFTSGDQGKTFTPVAVLGLTAGENLYLEGEGWVPRSYVPAYARRYPFCMAQVRVQDKVQENRLICVEKSFLDDAGEALFDEAGKALPRWEAIQRLLTEFEADLERTREACSILADYALHKQGSLRFDVIYEDWRTNDWSYNYDDGTPWLRGTANGTADQDGTFFTQNSPQKSTFVGLRYKYMLD